MNIDEYKAMVAKEKEEAESKANQPQEPEKEVKAEDTSKNEPKTPVEPEEPIIEKIKIGEEEFTPEEVAEWRQGYLRQSDYTKKTQDVANQRKELQEAVELYEYLKANPDVAKRMVEEGNDSDEGKKAYSKVDPVNNKVKILEQQIREMSLKMEVSRLENKYKDFEIMEVAKVATDAGITDLEKAYKLWKAEKTPETPKQVDRKALEKEIRAKILKEMKEESTISRTIIDSKATTPPSVPQEYQMSAAEMKVANAFGMDAKSYSKWMGK